MEKITHAKEEIESEIEELEADQHPNFFRAEPRGRERMSILLLELNSPEKEEINNSEQPSVAPK